MSYDVGMHGYGMRKARRYRQQQGGIKDYLLPFLIFICFGLIVVLGVGLWRSFFGAERDAAAYMHLDEGTVELKVWGTENYFALNADTLVMQGDALRTDGGSKLILEFFDGTIMRVGANSEVIFDSINEDSGSPKIELTLESGSLWFNKIYKDTAATEISVTSDHLVVKSDVASVFMVDKTADQQVVRVKNVFEDNGGLTVDVLNKDDDSVVESEKIGVAQQITFTKKVLQSYWDFKSPTVLSGVSDNFKSSEWYEWNTKEDKNPTQFQKVSGDLENIGLVKVEEEKVENGDEPVEPEVTDEADKDGEDETKTTEEDADAESDETKEPVASGDVAKPGIVSVAGSTQKDANGYYVVKSNPATLMGSASGAAKVVVNGYELQKYQSGSGTWSYYANADFGLMKEGENTYEIYSLDAEGNKSEVMIVKVIYAPPAPVVEEKKPEDAPPSETAAPPETTPETPAAEETTT